MSTREVLINFFQLPLDEIIFQDYGCALHKVVLNHGRLFVCENYLCFYANILGMKTILVIKITDIISIEKRLIAIIQNAIMIQTKDKLHLFSSFSDRDSVYSFLFALWKGQPVNFTPEQEDDSLSKSDSVDGIEGAEVEVNFLQSDPSIEDQQELMKVNFSVSVDKFFELFVANDAIFTLIDHRKNRGDIDTTLSKWLLHDEESGGYQRELHSVIKITDVPFRDKSRIHKIQTYRKDKDTLIVLSMTKTLDVPFASSFQVEERWEVSPIENEPNKCQLRSYGWVVFLKSFYLKKTIQVKAIQSLKEDYEVHMNGMRKKLESMNSKSPPISTQSFDGYEESKIMDSNLILGARDEVSNHREKTYQPQKEQRIQLVGIIMLGLLILIQTLIIVLIIKTMRTFESRMDALELKLSNGLLSVPLLHLDL